MAGTPDNPGTRGTSPSPAHDKASETSWNSWNQHGNKTPQDALNNQPRKTPIDPSSMK